MIDVLLRVSNGPRRYADYITGMRLSRAFGLTDTYWIDMQAHYDIEIERDKRQTEIDAITPLIA